MDQALVTAARFQPFIDRMLGLVNGFRAGAGLPPVSEDPGLTATAQAWAGHMAATGVLSHGDFAGRLAGRLAAEDIAEGQPTPRAVLAAWEASPAHRANLLGNYAHAGFGFALDRNGVPYWCIILADAPAPKGPATMPATPITVAVLNRSTVLTDGQVEAVVPALQIQVDRDFLPAWAGATPWLAGGVTVVYHPRDFSSPPEGAWVLGVFDDSDQAGALGYHDDVDGLPLGKVFARTDLRFGAAPSVTTSHELIEMLADPYIDQTVRVPLLGGGTREYAREPADAPEADEYAYEINGVKVSNFVYPAWFDPHALAGSRFDHLGLIKAPFQVLPGGYIGYRDNGGDWVQAFGQHVGPPERLARHEMTSRRLRLRHDKAKATAGVVA